MKLRNITKFALVSALALGTVACGKEVTETRNYTITGFSGTEQVGAQVQIDVTAYGLPAVTDYEETVNQYNDRISSKLNQSIKVLAPVAGEDRDTLLEESIEQQITKQLSVLDTNLGDGITLDSVDVISVYFYQEQCDEAAQKFLDGTGGSYSGVVCTGTDSDAPGTPGYGQITATAIRANPAPGQAAEVELECPVTGGGCKLKPGQNNNIPQLPGAYPVAPPAQ